MLNAIDKNIAQDYRKVLKTNSAPQFIDTDIPITPVAVINSGVATPNTRQTLHYTEVAIGNASTQNQIASITGNNKIYVLGAYMFNNAAAATSIQLYDAISGAAPAVAANSVASDAAAARIMCFTLVAGVGVNTQWVATLPVEIKQGLRVVGGGAGQTASCFIWWIEESNV